MSEDLDELGDPGLDPVRGPLQEIAGAVVDLDVVLVEVAKKV